MYLTETEYKTTMLQAGHHLNLLDWEPAAAWINIYGTMLFPDDQKKRLSWISRIFLCTRAKMHQNLLDTKQIDMQTACQQSGQDFAELAVNMGGPEKFTQLLFEERSEDIAIEGSGRLENGLIVGEIFLELLNSGKSLSKAINDYHKQAKVPISEGSIRKNLWPQYLPMVHYWGAMVTFARHDGLHLHEDVDCPDAQFDCPKFRAMGKPDGIKGFIRIAESYLFQSIRNIPRRTGPKTPLLDIKKMFFVLHPFTVFSTLAENCHKIDQGR